MKTALEQSKIYSFLMFVSFFLCTSSFSISQTWDEMIKLTASDAGEEDRFGARVAISGDRAIVGAYTNDDDGDDSGSAYIFELVEDEWVETQKLTASDASEHDQFGRAVSISGDRVIVGAPRTSGDGSFSGSAYVFELLGDTWVEIEELTASDAAEYDYFGWSVAISGDTVVVGAYSNDDDGLAGGSVFIFGLVEDEWVETQKLTASDAEFGDAFGRSVAISGDRIIVGAYTKDDFGEMSGAAYIFELTDALWVEIEKLNASDASEDDLFGGSVSISGDIAIVGAVWNDGYYTNSGSAYIFELVEDEWVETQKLSASDSSAFDHFGGSVSISGNKVAVGARYNDAEGGNSGAAYMFEMIEDTWVEIEKITASDAGEENHFGGSVSIFGDRAIVGASWDDDAGFKSGSAYIFEACWTLPIVTASADDLEVCEGDTVTLSGEGATTYTWDDGIADAIPFTPPLGTSTYTVIGTDEDGCENTATIEIIVHGLPIITAIADDLEVCEWDMVTLTGAGAAIYVWDGGVTNGIPFIPPFGITTYTVIGTDLEGCFDTASIDITVLYEAIYISFATSDELFGDDAAINITVTGGNPAYSFDWDNDGTGDFDDEEDLTAIPGGTYIIVVEDETGCTGTRTIEVDTELGTDKLDFNNITVFPNPTSDHITIEFEGEFNYSLVSLNGKILSVTKAVNQTTLDLSEFADGIYFLEIQSENVSEFVKVLKQ
ncbi:MAG: T9SS type A sorting domain-containing protein [Crocinitomix sp.]|nr:T9SS type A sorting domain-containing protein [Crocinitomix sp.]